MIAWTIWMIFLIIDFALYAAALHLLGALIPPWKPWLKWIPGSGFYLYAAMRK